jgi:hypothetical protein
MARDLSARPQILNLKIKDVVFKTTGKVQYAEVLVNGKTGTRPIPLIQSIPYIKEWLSNHPTRNNPNSPLFIGLGRQSMGKQFTPGGLHNLYDYYKKEFFPKLLDDPTISHEDKAFSDYQAGRMYLTEEYMIFTKGDKKPSKRWDIIIPLTKVVTERWNIEEKSRRKQISGGGSGIDNLVFGAGVIHESGKSHRLVVPYIDENGIPQEPRFGVSSIGGTDIRK